MPKTATRPSTRSSPSANQLLAALPAEDLQRMQQSLELVHVPLGSVVYEPGTKMDHVFFPTTSIVSLLYVMHNGSSAEIAVTGHDGLVGIAIFMGGGSTSSRAVVQSEGEGYRMRAATLQTEFSRSGALHHLALCYTQALITQMAQTAVCNRHHDIQQQLCRWLLLSLDLLPGPDLLMTQELIANMLGVRREGVTAAAGALQAMGIISYRRGHITVLDRPHLEKRVCECYGAVKKEYERLLPYTVRSPLMA
jgi:CRP-like cAMP-binding protein